MSEPSTFHAGPDEATREVQAVRERLLAHARRCRAAGLPRRGEAENAVAAFLAKGGSVTRCPTVHLVASA